MGKIHILTENQKEVLSFLSKQPSIADRFYFTGGTALAAYYLSHRYSDDIDLFCQSPISPESLFPVMSALATHLHAPCTPQWIDSGMYVCIFQFPKGQSLKVDLCSYPYPRLQTGQHKDGFPIDSLFDIAVNKMVTVGQRASAKDFVDLYYLFDQFGYWDLAHGAKKKFNMDIDPILFAGDLLAVDDIDVLPRMIKPLTIAEVKDFFHKKAVEIGKTSVRE